MGCAPSIHVSQSGVFYCRDEIREGSSPRPRPSSPSEIVGHIRTSSDSGSHISSSSSSRNRGIIKKGQNSHRGSSIEAETQTYETRTMDTSKGERKEVLLGPMKLYQSPMQIMLVFSKEDAQTDSFLHAAERGGYVCQICKTSEEAMEQYINVQPDVVFIDMRGNSVIDGERLCRIIRAKGPRENSIIIAVVKASHTKSHCLRKIFTCGIWKDHSPRSDEPLMLPLLKAGFDRRFIENANVGACHNELLMLEQGEVQLMFKLRATSCLFSAIENSHDAVEIATLDPDRADHQVEYVNRAYEKMTGYRRSEVVGHPQSLINSEHEKPELYESITSHLKKGKEWEGKIMGIKRSGENISQNVHIIPVLGKGGKVAHHVTVKRDLTQSNTLNMNMEVNMHMETPTTASGVTEQVQINGGLIRRHSTTTTTKLDAPTKLEAPITKVINMLSAAQENSPMSVVQALDRVLEILRTAELYSPFTTTEDERMTNELVGGLISNGRRPSCDVPKPSHKDPLQVSVRTPLSHLQEAPPEVMTAMVDEADWDFDILKLEKASNHRPLYFLGTKILNRFRACEILNISEDVLKNWLQLIELNYHSKNAYHNSTHAADVLHATAVFLAKERVKAVLEPLDEVASLIAAVVHDVDHPGYTNSFLCNAGNELAILYNDIAVLESHHAALAFKLTARDERSNIFKGLDMDVFRTIRQAIIDMVMATEMTRHFEHLSKFVNSINKRRTSSMDEVHSVHSGRGTPDSTASSAVALNTPENRTLIKRMLIKCADIANPARPRYLCIEWANRIADEYFSQTDEEKRRGLPVVMPVFDRQTCNVPRSQVWFIDYFVSDLYDAWDAFAFVPETIRHLTDNHEHWKKAAEDWDASRRTPMAGTSASGNVSSGASPRNPTSTSGTSSEPPSSSSTSLTSA
ncbi:high affinity cAMP-specific and IBMX-insensitive 3',5'-cyclic phosphodiesterase 8A-like isoform X2 [Acropora millepora]|uniref:high affinity cAMP-specific and IBMX-insensitive 3',5'-cyclic phosphodiesterase 8A-like isoform X2 n=1 Tax=Acropora millepora TaxID=45264 RepID=UPI0010FC6AB5|nr:high affinity cAMP-specific and IBMX-insensitive 3',5'-cyclic phosphodiesterase 8A-like isoform X2 [Acropora millepora]